MFDIDALKEMKLAELQQIAKSAKIIKTTGVKKDTLIEQILEQQNNAVPTQTIEKPVEIQGENKPKRARILPEKTMDEIKVPKDLFADPIV